MLLFLFVVIYAYIRQLCINGFAWWMQFNRSIHALLYQCKRYFLNCMGAHSWVSLDRDLIFCDTRIDLFPIFSSLGAVNQTHLHPTVVISCLRLGSNQANPFDLIYTVCVMLGSN